MDCLLEGMSIMSASKMKKLSHYFCDHSTQGISTSPNTLWLVLDLGVAEWLPRGHAA